MVVQRTLLAACLLISFLPEGRCRKRVFNEDDLAGTCSNTCEEIGEVVDFEGCTKVSGCVTSSGGWIRGLSKCDNCECECDGEETTGGDVVAMDTTFEEEALFGTCSGTCEKAGLVKSNFMGFQVRFRL